jgi:hypothetical protein
MATPREYFEKDGSSNLRIHQIQTVTDKVTDERIETISSVSVDFEAGVTYGLIYIPKCRDPAGIINYYISDVQRVLNIADKVSCERIFPSTDQYISLSDLRFSGRVIALQRSGDGTSDKKGSVRTGSKQRFGAHHSRRQLL